MDTILPKFQANIDEENPVLADSNNGETYLMFDLLKCNYGKKVIALGPVQFKIYVSGKVKHKIFTSWLRKKYATLSKKSGRVYSAVEREALGAIDRIVVCTSIINDAINIGERCYVYMCTFPTRNLIKEFVNFCNAGTYISKPNNNGAKDKILYRMPQYSSMADQVAGKFIERLDETVFRELAISSAIIDYTKRSVHGIMGEARERVSILKYMRILRYTNKKGIETASTVFTIDPKILNIKSLYIKTYVSTSVSSSCKIRKISDE